MLPGNSRGVCAKARGRQLHASSEQLLILTSLPPESFARSERGARALARVTEGVPHTSCFWNVWEQFKSGVSSRHFKATAPLPCTHLLCHGEYT